MRVLVSFTCIIKKKKRHSGFQAIRFSLAGIRTGFVRTPHHHNFRFCSELGIQFIPKRKLAFYARFMFLQLLIMAFLHSSVDAEAARVAHPAQAARAAKAQPKSKVVFQTTSRRLSTQSCCSSEDFVRERQFPGIRKRWK